MNTPYHNVTSIKIKRIVKDLEKALKTVGDHRTELLDKYVVKDEKGDFNPLSPDLQIQPKLQKEFSQEMDKFFKRTLSIDRKKLLWKEIQDAKFTAQELIDLEPIYTEVTVVQ